MKDPTETEHELRTRHSMVEPGGLEHVIRHIHTRKQTIREDSLARMDLDVFIRLFEIQQNLLKRTMFVYNEVSSDVQDEIEEQDEDLFDDIEDMLNLDVEIFPTHCIDCGEELPEDLDSSICDDCAEDDFCTYCGERTQKCSCDDPCDGCGYPIADCLCDQDDD